MKKVLITGATSGIGYELAVQFINKGYKVGVVARRTKRLEELKNKLGKNLFYATLDVTDFEKAEQVYHQLIEEMNGMDIMILNAGVGSYRDLQPWDSDKKTLDINILAFAHGCHFAFEYFSRDKSGQIVGMSSISKDISNWRSAAYTASKAFVNNYMTSFRQKAKRSSSNIAVTELIPGFVESEMTAGQKGMFWVANTQKAVKQMIDAIEKRKNHAYITKRWRLIAWFLKFVPQFIWNRI